MLKADDLILQGKLEVQKKAAGQSLRFHQAALPHGVLLAVVRNLLEDVTDGKQGALSSYEEYLEILVNARRKVSFLHR